MPTGSDFLLLLLSLGSPTTDCVTIHRYSGDVSPAAAALPRIRPDSACVQYSRRIRTSVAATSLTSHPEASDTLNTPWTTKSLVSTPDLQMSINHILKNIAPQEMFLRFVNMML